MTLGLTRFGYFGSTASVCRSQRRTVFRDRPVRRAISRSGTFSRKYIRLILANMPTVITFVSPAQRLSRAFNHVGQNSMKIFSSSRLLKYRFAGCPGALSSCGPPLAQVKRAACRAFYAVGNFLLAPLQRYFSNLLVGQFCADINNRPSASGAKISKARFFRKWKALAIFLRGRSRETLYQYSSA
nr:hypothetical protein [Burkholderia glumae]